MGMEKYLTGFQTGNAAAGNERELPEIDIAGTLFIADIEKLELREAANPHNRMPMPGVKEEMGFSHFLYDTRAKNLYTGPVDIPTGIPDHVRIVLLPPLKDIDPVGLAKRYGITESSKDKKHRPVTLTTFSKETAEPVKRKGLRI
jgi:hypothetical protein